MIPTDSQFKQVAVEAAQRDGWALPAGFDTSERSAILTYVKAGYDMATEPAAGNSHDSPEAAPAPLADAELTRIADRLADYKADDGPADKHTVIEHYLEDVPSLLVRLQKTESRPAASLVEIGAAAATSISGGAEKPLGAQRLLEIETTWRFAMQEPLGAKDSDALYRVHVPELLAGYHALAQLVAKYRLTQHLEPQIVAAAIHDGLRITEEPVDLARIVTAALAASPASVTSPVEPPAALAAVSTDGGGPATSGLPVALQDKLRREMSRMVSEQQANELRENGGHGDFDAGAGQGRAFLAAEILADFAAPTSPVTGETAAPGSLPTRSRAATDGAALIAAERQEQIHKHGFDVQNDADYGRGELVQAAATCLSLYVTKPMATISVADQYNQRKMWPWQSEFGMSFYAKIWGKSDVDKLKVAGALIAAEIDRLQAPATDETH